MKATAVPPATKAPSEPLDIVLHIGTGKTGSSSIQHFLHRNRERLAELGLLYPRSPGLTRHTKLGLFIRPDDLLLGYVGWRDRRRPPPAVFRHRFQSRLFAEIEDSGMSRVLFSDEALYGSPVRALRGLAEFTDRIARSLRLVAYLRRQDDHLVSRYQQVVKVGETMRLADWARLDFSKTYDYYVRLRTWGRLLEPDELVVRPFERDRFVSGSLFQDFFDAAGIDATADGLDQVQPVNESLDAEAVEFLRILNLCRVEHEGAERGLINNRVLVRRLARESAGPTLTLPTQVLDAFMDRWAESNQAVARDMLREPSGQLFRVPRKVTNTTTEQYLDPSRLEHFLTLLELPGHLHVPLRRLAEREARVHCPTGHH